MRSVPTALNTELLKEANFLCHLVEMHLSSTIYFTDLDIDVFYNSKQYLSRGLSFEGAAYSLSPQIDKISFQIDNVGLEFSAFVLNQEVRGKRCTIRLAALGGMETREEITVNGRMEIGDPPTLVGNDLLEQPLVVAHQPPDGPSLEQIGHV